MKAKSENIKARKISVLKLLPNIFTTIGLCSGLTGIRFALEGNWQNAVLCILVAACFDMIDGLSARLLKAFSFSVLNSTVWQIRLVLVFHLLLFFIYGLESPF